jgi:hypothetical protein
MAGPFGPTTFDIPVLTIEAIICEVIDNSIAAGAKHIHLSIEDDFQKNGSDSFNFSVFDNGTKIRKSNWTQTDIEEAFEIEYDPANPPERQDDEIGLFHIGMKVSTISKFNHVSMITLNSEETHLELHGTYPHRDMIASDKELFFGAEQNPSISPPDGFDTGEMVDILRARNMSTFVGVTKPRRALIQGVADKTERQHVVQLKKHLRTYLGIAYQLYLEDEDFILTMGTRNVNWDQKIHPVDPFWQEFTAAKLLEHADTLGENDKKIVKNLARFGTFSQNPDTIEVGESKISIQGFIIPHGDKYKSSQKALLAQFPKAKVDNNSKTTAFTGVGDSSGSGSDRLKSFNTGGFFFYRGKRCINFGGDGLNNHGFYKLKNPINASWATRFKAKISYTKDLDHLLELHPNKDGYNDIDEEIWTHIKSSLSKSLGNSNYAPPYNVERSFCLFSGGNSQFHHMQSDYFSYRLCDVCTLRIHAKNDICGNDVCENCNESPSVYGCFKDDCKFTCEYCSETGIHPPGKCEEIQCDECEGFHEGDICPCAICGVIDCGLHDEDDDEDDDEGGDEEGGEEEEEEIRIPEFQIDPDDGEVLVILYPEANHLNIEVLKTAIEHLGIDFNELQ